MRTAFGSGRRAIGAFTATALTAVAAGGAAYWYASAKRTLEIAQLERNTITHAPVTEDTPRMAPDEGANPAERGGIRNHGRFAPLPENGRTNPVL